MPTNPDAARQQAQSEHRQNQSPSNTFNWDFSTREAYETERARLRQQSEQK